MTLPSASEAFASPTDDRRPALLAAALAFARELDAQHRRGIAHGKLGADGIRAKESGGSVELVVDGWPPVDAPAPAPAAAASPWKHREVAGAADDVRALADLVARLVPSGAAGADYRGLTEALDHARTGQSAAGVSLEQIIGALDALTRMGPCALCGEIRRIDKMNLGSRGYVCSTCGKQLVSTPGADLDMAFSEGEQDAMLAKHRRTFLQLAAAVPVLAGLVIVAAVTGSPLAVRLAASRMAIYLYIGVPVGAVFEALQWRAFARRNLLRDRFRRGEIGAIDYTPLTPEQAAAELRKDSRRRLLLGLAIVIPLVVLAVIELAGSFSHEDEERQVATAEEILSRAQAGSGVETNGAAQAAALLDLIARSKYNGGFKAVKETGSFELTVAGAATVSGDITVTIELPDKLHVRIVEDGHVVDHVLAGDHGWTRRDDRTEDLTPARVAELKLELERHPDTVLTFRHDEGAELRMQADERIDGAPHKVATLTIAGHAIDVVVDPATKRVRRVRTSGEHGAISEDQLDYDRLANVRGIRVAAQRQTTGWLALFDENGVLLETINGVERNPVIPETEFERPAH
jgi:hypothetical protein